MNSEQEKFVRELIEHSIGGSLIFHPHNYNTGSGWKEPCDLVWASNNCLVLINMTIKKSDQNKMIKHNMGQLSGWMDAWKKGEHLRGQFNNENIEIGFDDYKHKILISIGHAGNDHAQILDDWKIKLNAKGLDCTLCANLTQGALTYLAQYGGSLVDLIYYLILLKDQGGILNHIKALSLMREYHHNEFKKAYNVSHLSSTFLNENQKAINTNINHIKVDSQVLPGIELKEFFNDLAWNQVIALIIHLGDIAQRIEDVPSGEDGPKYAIIHYDFPPYAVLVSVRRIFNDPTDFVNDFNQIHTDTSAQFPKHVKIGIIMLLISTPEGIPTRSFVFALDPREEIIVSASEQLMNAFS